MPDGVTTGNLDLCCCVRCLLSAVNSLRLLIHWIFSSVCWLASVLNVDMCDTLSQVLVNDFVAACGPRVPGGGCHSIVQGCGVSRGSSTLGPGFVQVFSHMYECLLFACCLSRCFSRPRLCSRNKVVVAECEDVSLSLDAVFVIQEIFVIFDMSCPKIVSHVSQLMMSE